MADKHFCGACGSSYMYCACEDNPLAPRNVAQRKAEEAANAMLEHVAKSHPRPEDGICDRCVEIIKRAGA